MDAVRVSIADELPFQTVDEDRANAIDMSSLTPFIAGTRARITCAAVYMKTIVGWEELEHFRFCSL